MGQETDTENHQKREIQVRSLTGESITVPVELSNTVQEFKLLLKKIFPPASTFPNFHLFLKGVKLNVQNQISSYSVGSGEFLVLVPFGKKFQQQAHKSDDLATPSTGPTENASSKLADSSWSDLMQDLSSLKGIPAHENQPDVNIELKGTSESPSLPRKRKRGFITEKNKGALDDIVLEILQLTSSNVFDEQNSKKFIQLLDSVNCLSDQVTGECMVRGANPKDNRENPCTDSCTLCMCPLWLKKILKAFAFLNIYSAFLCVRRLKVTLSALENALDLLGRFGFQLSTADLENISMLCPKVVTIVNEKSDVPRLRDTLLILKGPEEQKGYNESEIFEGKNIAPITRIVNAMKRRENSFISTLSKALSLALKTGNKLVDLLSLEDLISVKESDSTRVVKKEKQGRSRGSNASSSHSAKPRCHDTNPLLPMEMVEHLKSGIGSQGQIVHIEELSDRRANFVEIPSELSESTHFALKSIGITRLYSHQAESIKASLAGKHVVVATMTSSGKSLCYNVPVLEVLSHKLLECALYLFPTKALAQDQLRTLLTMNREFDDSLKIGIYDGDTSHKDRLWLRDNARLLITNPDMLHVSILPFHGQFKRILANLRFVIVDEAHAYKGAFGCHTALILRRLRRICSHVYGSDPAFIFSTATSANPREHTMAEREESIKPLSSCNEWFEALYEELANLPTVELIQKDGSPSGPKLFVLWNPPFNQQTVWKGSKNSMKGNVSDNRNVVAGRSSPIFEVSTIFAEMVQHGLRCIAFCKTRKLCELVLSYTREILQEATPCLVDSICAYRGGYIAEDRRRIESDFFSGRIYGIAATNALELGIDVGHIDVTLHLGFPGSIASLWQQAGRSGRREKPSLAVYVAFDGPLDQYFMKYPEKLFHGPIECCHIDAKNPQVLEQHLVCAALEHPLSFLYDEIYFGSGLESTIMTLKNKGLLACNISQDSSARIWSYIGHEKSPSIAVSIRAIETERYKVINKQTDEVLEEIEESRAFFQVYEGAVYMNQGKVYLVHKLDLSSKIAWCQQADLNYYTKTRDYTDVHVVGGKIAYEIGIGHMTFGRTTAQAHSCRVTTTWFGFRRICRRSNRVFDTVEVSLPAYSYDSQAAWIRVPPSVKIAVETLNYSFRGGLHAAGHALLNVVPLYIICNSSDLASECVNPYDARYAPERILLYDPHPGGTGISAQVQPLFTKLLAAALELLMSCECQGDTGCPNCVQNIACGEYNEVLHKDAAIMIIKAVLDMEKFNFPKVQDASAAS